MLDVGKIRHAVEQRPTACVRQCGAGEIDEFRMDIVLRDRGANPVQPDLGHHPAQPPAAWPRSANCMNTGTAAARSATRTFSLGVCASAMLPGPSTTHGAIACNS